MNNASEDELFIWMDNPINLRTRYNIESFFYINKIIEKVDPIDIFNRLIFDFDKFSIFRKEQILSALCFLHNKISEQDLIKEIKEFLLHNTELSLLNEVECLQLRITRKFLVINMSPKIRENIDKIILEAPERIKFVFKPSILSQTLIAEIEVHNIFFEYIKKLDFSKAEELREQLTKLEISIEDSYKQALKEVQDTDREIRSFDSYGIDHDFTFQIIIKQCGVNMF